MPLSSKRVKSGTNRVRRGFTLMELLVALGIFSMVVTAASDIFLMTSRAQRKIFAMERAQADARLALEAMIREVRSDRIDYASYAGGVPVPSDILYLRDSRGESIDFRISRTEAENDLCADAASRPCALVKVGSGDIAAITPRGVRVLQLKFLISPTVDPMAIDAATGTYLSDLQPRVTVIMDMEALGERAGESSLVYTQTTATSRQYRR